MNLKNISLYYKSQIYHRVCLYVSIPLISQCLKYIVVYRKNIFHLLKSFLIENVFVKMCSRDRWVVAGVVGEVEAEAT